MLHRLEIMHHSRLSGWPGRTTGVLAAFLAVMLLAAAAWADVQLPDERLRELYPGFAKVYDQLTPRDQAKTETLRRFHAARGAIDGYRPDSPESFDAAWRALTTLYDINGQKNLDNVFWLLDIGAIPPETSARMADVRNRMVERACENVTRSEGGELHRIDFSPATNAKSDIDQTFRPVEKLKQTGSDLVATFDTTFQSEYGINPRHMDVVSHPFEARIPAWETDVQVHDFVVQLRRGSALLAGNEEAYFLEGAFRMQIDKRSFESDAKLYTVFTVNHGAEGDGVSKLDIAEPRVPVTQYRDTARKMVYRVRPSTQRSYAFGSAVGNWYFYVKHGKGTRYACKYGLRSFAEGVGWLALPAEPDPNQPLPKTYLELLKAPIERSGVFDAAWDKHYKGRFALPKEELKWALETALEIRALGDGYNAEARARILAPRAQELGGTVFKGNEEVFLSAAEKQLNSHLQRMMIHNMEICLPARLADYLEPKVSLRRLGYSREQIRQMSDAKRTSTIDEARKRLRASALFETLHALHVMDPEARDNAIARAILRHPKFARTLEALQRMVQTKPVMLGVDIEARRQLMELKKGQRDGTKVVVTDEVARVRELAREAEKKLKADIDDMRRAVDAEVLVPLSDPQPESRTSAIGELRNRFRRAVDEAGGALMGAAQFMTDAPMRQEAINRMRQTVLESFGFEFRKDWTAIETIARSDYRFNARTLISNTVNLSNADTLITIARAYRDSNGDPEQVGNALLLEAAQRLPFVSPALQFKSFAEGDLKTGGILAVTVLFPEIGPVVMVFNLAKNTIELALDIQTDRAIEAYYQGNVPYADGSPGPAESFHVSGGRVIGILEPVFEKLRTHRAKMMQRAADPSTSPTERQEIQEMLQKVYTPDAEGAKRFLYEYYDPELETLLEKDGVPREVRLAKKLSSGRPPIMSMQPEDVLNPANLPPELKAYLGRVLEDYRHGRNEYAPWAAAARNEVLQREWFFTTDHYVSRQKWESMGTDLTVLMADMFANALIERGQGRAVQPRLRFDTWNAQHVKRYFEGCPGRALVPLRSLEAAVPPDAPSLLAPYPGTTQEERLKAFFEEHDKRLNEILRKRTPQPVPEEELDAFKLGRHHADLTPEAPEEREVKYAFLVAFFMSRIDAYWKLPIHYRDQGWLGDPLPNMDALRCKLAVQMSYDYVSGLLAAVGRRQQQLEREMQDAQLPHAVALERARAALLGGSDPLAGEDPNAPSDNSILDPEAMSAARAETLDQIALASDDPHLFADDAAEAGLRDLLADSGLPPTAPASKVEIVLPSSQLTEGTPLKVQCKVSATDHYVRPFQCDWAIEGADGAKPVTGAPETNLRFVSRNLGAQLQQGEYKVSVSVTDSSDPPQQVGVDAKAFRVEGKPEIQSRLSAKLEGHYTDGPLGGWAGMTIDIEPWVGLLPEGDHYAAIRPMFGNKHYVLLCRIDCGAGSVLHVEGADHLGHNSVTLREAALPLIHTGENKFRLRIYTGNAQMPVLDQQMSVVVPAPVLAQNKTPDDVARAEKYAGMSRQSAEEARQKYYQTRAQPMPDYGNSCYDHWDNWVSAKTRAEWDEPRSPWEPTWEADRWRQYAAVLDQLHAALNEAYYYRKPKENFWRKTSKSGWASLRRKPDLLIRHGRIDQASMWLAAVEKAAGLPPGPLYQYEKPYGEDMWVTYNALMMAYAKHRLDPGRAREVYDRLKAWGATEGAKHVWENNKRWLERAEACRAFFHPEAFDGTSVPVPLPGQRPEDAGVVVTPASPTHTPAPERPIAPTAAPSVTQPPPRARQTIAPQPRQSSSPAVLRREADDELNATWQKLHAVGDGKQKERLRNAQRLWIKLRDADAECVPGGPASDKGLAWLAESTRARTRHLQECLNVVLGKPPDTLPNARAAFKTADSDLNAAYQFIVARLDAQTKEKLVKAQRIWIELRDADCMCHSSDTNSAAYLSCLTSVTRNRILELKEFARIQGLF